MQDDDYPNPETERTVMSQLRNGTQNQQNVVAFINIIIIFIIITIIIVITYELKLYNLGVISITS